MQEPMRIVFATNNPHKLQEIRLALDSRFQLVSLAEIGFSGEIPETGKTLEENAMQKANFIFERYGVPVFADDTGLEVAALDGEPGVDTAHYSGSRNPEANMDKLLKALEGTEKRNAKFKTVIAYQTGSEERLFTGEVEGAIATEKQGKRGFGYDPIFLPEGGKRTFAEMSLQEKSKTNHRVRALEKFVDFLKNAY